MRTIVALFGLFAAAVAPAEGQKGDCFSFLRGSNPSPSGQVRRLSEVEEKAAMGSRVCVMSFVQLEALKPVLTADPALSVRHLRIESLYRRATDAESMQEAKPLIEAYQEQVHELFRDVRNLPSSRLARIADHLRSATAAVQAEGHDPLQAELFARWIQVDRLRDEGNLAEVRNVVAELRRSTKAGSLADSGSVDSAEAGTYFRAETLWTALQAFEVEAWLSAEISATDAAKWLVAYSRLPATSLSQLPSPSLGTILARAGERFATVLSRRDLKALREVDGVSGVTWEANQLDIYVGGGDGPAAQVFRVRRKAQGLAQIEVVDAAKAFQDHVAATLRRHSSPRFRLFALDGHDGGYTLRFGDRAIKVTATELASLRSGAPLPSYHPLSAEILSSENPLVLFSHPLMTTKSRFLHEAEDFAAALRFSYPGTEVIRDDFDPATTPARARQLAGFKMNGAGEMIAVVAGDAFTVDDKKAVRNLEEELRALGVPVRTWNPGGDWTDGTGRAVVVISGHIDSNMAAFVRDMGRAGAFRGNYVVFGSCYSELSSSLVQEINEAFGAAGTFRFQGNINAYDLADSVVALARGLGEGAGRLGFIDLLSRSLKEFRLRGVWTICVLLDRWGWARA